MRKGSAVLAGVLLGSALLGGCGQAGSDHVEATTVLSGDSATVDPAEVIVVRSPEEVQRFRDRVADRADDFEFREIDFSRTVLVGYFHGYADVQAPPHDIVVIDDVRQQDGVLQLVVGFEDDGIEDDDDLLRLHFYILALDTAQFPPGAAAEAILDDGTFIASGK